MVLLIALAPMTALALDQANTAQELVDKTAAEDKLTAVVFIPASHPDWAKYKSMIEEFEKLDSSVNFVLVDVENPEMQSAAMVMGVTVLPTTLISKGGAVLTGLVGLPKDLAEMQAAFKVIGEAVKKLEQQPPPPQLEKAPPKETIDFNPNRGKVKRVEYLA